MALLLEQKQVYGIIKGYNDKPDEPAANVTATEKAAFKDWMNRHGVASSTILLGMEPRIQEEYMVIDDAKMLWEKLASAYQSKLKLNIFEIRGDPWSIKLQDCGDVNNYTLRINRKINDYNICPGPTATSTATNDAADTDTNPNAKTIAKMRQQLHIYYLLCGIPRNDEWKVFLELMMDKNAMMTTTPEEIVTKLVEKEAAIKRENGPAPEALLFAKKGGKGGRGGNVGKSPKRDKRDKRDNKDDKKEKDLQKCFHCQRQGHITENCLSKQHGDPAKAADTAATASTEASVTSTLTTSIENYWMVASSSASSSYWFIDCGCMTHISGRWSMFITYTEYPPNTKMVNGYNGPTSFASGYASVRLICLLPDGKTEMIIFREVVHLPGLLNLISQSQIMDKDVKVKLVNCYGLKLYNRHGKLIASAPQVDGLFVLDRVLHRSPELTKYTNIDNNHSCLVALQTTGHASRHDAEKRMLWHRRLAPVGLKALEIMPKVVADAQTMTRKCECESFIKCKVVRKPFTPVTSHASEPLQLVHLEIYGPLETAIGGGRYMLLFIDDATRHTVEYILKYVLEALEKLREWKALREEQLGKQVKRFRTDGGGEYTSKKFTQYLKSDGILKETTMPYSPQSNGVVERANLTIMQSVRCMLDDAGHSKQYWAFAVSVAVYLNNCTPTRSVVGNTLYEACHRRNPYLKPLRVFGWLAFGQVPKENRTKLDYRATPGIFDPYSISTKQHFVYEPLAKTLHRSRDVVFRDGNRYKAPNAADEAILNEHFYRDVIEEPKPTKKESETLQPTGDRNSERQTEEPLDDNSPPDPPKPTKKSRELAGRETALGNAWKLRAEGSHRNNAGKGKSAESAQLALEDEEFEHTIPIHAAAAISDDYEDSMMIQSLTKQQPSLRLPTNWIRWWNKT